MSTGLTNGFQSIPSQKDFSLEELPVWIVHTCHPKSVAVVGSPTACHRSVERYR